MRVAAIIAVLGIQALLVEGNVYANVSAPMLGHLWPIAK